MAKILVIEECIDCPSHYFFGKNDIEICNKKEKRIESEEIPEWCPLDDYSHPDSQQSCSCADEIDQCIHCQERKFNV